MGYVWCCCCCCWLLCSECLVFCVCNSCSRAVCPRSGILMRVLGAYGSHSAFMGVANTYRL